MKITLLIILMFAGICLYGQSKIDTTLSTYLKNKNYVQLTDTTDMPLSIKPWAHVFINYFTNAKTDDYYIDLTEVHSDDNYISIHLFGLNGIKTKKEMEEKWQQDNQSVVVNGQTTEKPRPTIIGNASGKDGVLTLDKHTLKITFLAIISNTDQ